MSAVIAQNTCNWLCAGDAIFPEMLAAIEEAQRSVCLETYIFSPGHLAEKFRTALTQACLRGARVRVLVDAFGSLELPGHFWDPLRQHGGEVRRFNPVALNRFSIRNHRKLLVCDERVAFVGGFNIAQEYSGDGVKCGWCDVGLKVVGPLAAQLAGSFEEMFARADFRHKRFMVLRKSHAKKTLRWPSEQILLSGPGRGPSPIKSALRQDLSRARDVRIVMAYFLPTWRLRRDLLQVVRGGGRVRLILAGRSDVRASQLAGRSLYRRFLKGGVEIFEYQPQVLHSKLVIVDDVVYIGSANLDQRSLRINYELMIRFSSGEMAAQAREIFTQNLKHSRRIDLEQWRRSWTLLERLQQRLAYFLLVHVDPYLAGRQWRSLPD